MDQIARIDVRMYVQTSDIIHVSSFSLISIVLPLPLPVIRLSYLGPLVQIGLKELQINIDLLITQIFEIISFLLDFLFLKNSL